MKFVSVAVAFVAGAVGASANACTDGIATASAGGTWYGSNIWDKAPDATLSVVISNDVTLEHADSQVKMLTIENGASLEILSRILQIENVDCIPDCKNDATCEDDDKGTCVGGLTCECREPFVDSTKQSALTLNGAGSFGDCRINAGCEVGKYDSGAGCVACPSIAGCDADETVFCTTADDAYCPKCESLKGCTGNVIGGSGCDDTCEACTDGKGIDSETGTVCTEPEDGVFVGGDGGFVECDATCAACSGAGANACTDCRPTVSLLEDGSCGCKVGSWGNSDGCQSCPLGKSSAAGSTSEDQCVACPVNSYRGSDDDECQACPDNTDTCGGQGQTNENGCIAGGDSRDVCVSCSTVNGVEFSSVGGNMCSGCAYGEYDDGSGCQACPAVDSCSQSECTSSSDARCDKEYCDESTFCDGEYTEGGKHFCTSCGACPVIDGCDTGFCTSDDADAAQCQSCAAGWYCPKGDEPPCGFCVEAYSYQYSIAVEIDEELDLEEPEDPATWDPICDKILALSTVEDIRIMEAALEIDCTIDIVGTDADDTASIVEEHDTNFEDPEWITEKVLTVTEEAAGIILECGEEPCASEDLEMIKGAQLESDASKKTVGSTGDGVDVDNIESYSGASSLCTSIAALFCTAFAVVYMA